MSSEGGGRSDVEVVGMRGPVAREDWAGSRPRDAEWARREDFGSPEWL